MELAQIVDMLGTGVEAAGVAAIVIGAIVATVRAGARVVARQDSYHRYRRDLGRSILIGLELLVAGDIIRTVAVTPTFTSVGVLAAIVLIRTFLSFTLEAEITGKWPWQKAGSRIADEPEV